MSDEASVQQTTEPKEIVREVLERLELSYDSEGGIFRTSVRLETTEGLVLFSLEQPDLIEVMFRFPIFAPAAVRSAVGEFVVRMNYPARRMCWDMDFSDGEVRCRFVSDLLLGPLNPALVESLLRAVLVNAQAVFPYLNAVMTRAMTPEFAADQAMAAISSAYREKEE